MGSVMLVSFELQILTITHVQDALHLSPKISVTWCVDDVDLEALHGDMRHDFSLASARAYWG